MDELKITKITTSTDITNLDAFVRKSIMENSSTENIKKMFDHVTNHYPHAGSDCLPFLKQLASSLSKELK